jgi:hypothetical protein
VEDRKCGQQNHCFFLRTNEKPGNTLASIAGSMYPTIFS